MSTFKSGAIPDPRTTEEKLSDFTLGEIVAATNPVIWTEKPQGQWRTFPIVDQDGSGSCVAQTLAKQLGIVYYLRNGSYIPFSALHIYQRRANKPYAGMAGVNAFDIAREGVTLEDLVPSANMGDEAMDAVKIPQYKQDVGKVFKIGNYVMLPLRDIETVASVIQTTGKGVMVWSFWKVSEWNKPVPTVDYPNLGQFEGERHSVTAVDFTLYQGKKCLVIDDSWGTQTGWNGQRLVTEDFFSKRNFFAAYPIGFAFEEGQIQKPQYKFVVPMEFGMTNPDVKALQNILKYEGLFPMNTDSTGMYGALTAKGVLAFQKKYAVAPNAELDALKGRLVGQKTIAKLNQLYG